MNKIVIITGMHRSGTSCLTGCLQQKGLYLGEVFEENPFNKKGNREKKEVMQLNESLLRHSGGHWDVPPTEISWTNEHVQKRDDILADFKSSLHSIKGFKDPRVLHTLPFWQDEITEIQLVAAVRHPLLVAHSLYFRAHTIKHGNHHKLMTIQKGLELWEFYNTKLLAYLKKQPFPVISFDTSPSDFNASVDKISRYLNLPNQDDTTFRETNLINQKYVQENKKFLTKPILELYSELQQYFI
jgi:hypothetical protein